jgi:hypothetical protein
MGPCQAGHAGPHVGAHSRLIPWLTQGLMQGLGQGLPRMMNVGSEKIEEGKKKGEKK